MKKTTKSFISGALTMAILFACVTTALASSGALQISVSPISVMVNGEIFNPKDANGNNALVFTYNGTTYAPLRALAEAYGLTVGYDSNKNMATVTNGTTNVISSDDFTSVWSVKPRTPSDASSDVTVIVDYKGDMNMTEFRAWWKSLSEETKEEGAKQMAREVASTMPGARVYLYFSYNSYALGNAFSYGEVASANFKVADSWI